MKHSTHNNTHSPRQQVLLTRLALSGKLAYKNVSDLGISRATFARDMRPLLEDGCAERTGGGAGVVYTRGKAFSLARLDVTLYFSIDQKKRLVLPSIDFRREFDYLFTDTEREYATSRGREWKHRYDALSPSLQKQAQERLTIELAWKSSQIEGNTYTLLDTERLIRESKEAIGHPHEEAIMILNHKRALEYITEYREKFRTITKREIENIHTILTKELGVHTGLRKGPVGIVGTEYRPHDNVYQLGEAFDAFVTELNTRTGIERAFLALAGIAYLQPFEDGNKRTSRMLTNAILLSENLPPLSFRSIDEVEYKKAVIMLYEAHSLSYLKELFLAQYEEACAYLGSS